jgi:hypothetical protein
MARALGIEVIIASSSTGQGDIVAIFSDLISGWSMEPMKPWESVDQVPEFLSDEFDIPGMTG